MFRHPISICRARSLGFLRVFSGCSRLLRGQMGLRRKAKPTGPHCWVRGSAARRSRAAEPGLSVCATTWTRGSPNAAIFQKVVTPGFGTGRGHQRADRIDKSLRRRCHVGATFGPRHGATPACRSAAQKSGVTNFQLKFS